MNSSPHSPTRNAIPRNSFRRTLLQPVLHNISAIAPITLSDPAAYERIRPKSRKSNPALLLPLFVPVSPLLRYSYKKIGGTPLPQENSRLKTLTTCGMYHLRTSRISRQKTASVFYHLQTAFHVTTSVIYHLQTFFKMLQDCPSVFYHLQTTFHVTTSVIYHLEKNRGGVRRRTVSSVTTLGCALQTSQGEMKSGQPAAAGGCATKGRSQIPNFLE